MLIYDWHANSKEDIIDVVVVVTQSWMYLNEEINIYVNWSKKRDLKLRSCSIFFVRIVNFCLERFAITAKKLVQIFSYHKMFSVFLVVIKRGRIAIRKHDAVSIFNGLTCRLLRPLSNVMKYLSSGDDTKKRSSKATPNLKPDLRYWFLIKICYGK